MVETDRGEKETAELRRFMDLARIYREGLLDDTLRFWFPRCVDTVHGGYFTAFDRDGSLIDDDKSVWFQGRAAWLLGELYNGVERRDEWVNWCRSGIEFLDSFGFDPADGRMWFHVARDGRPIRKRRYAFSESFAAIAYGGEWYGYLHRDGTVSVPLKGNLWKGPFHLPRMQLECWRICERMATPLQSPDSVR